VLVFVLARRWILGIEWRSDIYQGCADAETTAFRGRAQAELQMKNAANTLAPRRIVVFISISLSSSYVP
jgi:hypothetical protein